MADEPNPELGQAAGGSHSEADAEPSLTTTHVGGGGRHLSPWQGGVLIGAAFAVDYVLFTFAFNTNYVRWYVANGALLALAVTVFSAIAELDDDPYLIAAEPNRYLASWFSYFGIAFFWLSDVVEKAGGLTRWEALDAPITMLFAIAWTAVAFAWLLVVVPVLYVVTIISGAPVRRTLRMKSGTLIVRRTNDDDPKRVNIGANIQKKPVTAANAVAAAVLYGLSFAL